MKIKDLSLTELIVIKNEMEQLETKHFKDILMFRREDIFRFDGILKDIIAEIAHKMNELK